MSYGVRYRSEFDSLSGLACKIEILKNGYAGAVTNITASTTPVLHRWREDEPNPPIKGSELEIKLLNENNNLPLSSLFSANDNEFLVKYWLETVVYFWGYIVQDDCSEEVLDYSHEIKIIATDGLGLLKGTKLDEASKKHKREIDYIGLTVTTDLLYGTTISPAVDVMVGDEIVWTDSTIKTIQRVQYPITGDYVTVFTSGGLPVGTSTVNISIRHQLNLNKKNRISDYLRICILETGNSLQTNIFGNLSHAGTTVGSYEDRFWEGVLIDGGSFLNGTEYDDCYTVLSKIMKPTGHTLLQCEGKWHIVRFGELRHYAADIPGLQYDSEWVSTVITYPVPFSIGVGESTIVETGLLESIVRPYKFVKNIFNYKQPDSLLRNSNFTELGAMLNTYTVGSETYEEYEMLHWNDGFSWDIGGTNVLLSTGFGWQRFIRVIKDALGNELQRYGIIKGGSTFGPYAASSTPFEVSAGDKIKISFSYKTIAPSALNETIVLLLHIVTKLPLAPRGINNRYIYQVAGSQVEWRNTPGYTYEVLGNSMDWQSVEVESATIPFDGLFFIQLPQANRPNALTGNPNETFFKDIRVEILNSVNQQSNIKGQTHTDTQSIETRNIYEEEISIDDSPRNTIAGTLFRDTFSGVVSNKTTRWVREGLTEKRRLGDIVSEEIMDLRHKERVKLEGTFYGLVQDNIITPITPCKKSGYTNAFFIPGTMEIDYRNDKWTGTLYEIYRTGEASAADSYEFKFLYNKK